MYRKPARGRFCALAAGLLLTSACGLFAQIPGPGSDPLADIHTADAAHNPTDPRDPQSMRTRIPREEGWPDSQGESVPKPLADSFPEVRSLDTVPELTNTNAASNTAPGPAVVSVGQLQHPLTSKGHRLVQKIEMYLRRGDRPKAQQEFHQALKEPSAAPYARALIGTDYLKNGQVRAAIPELEQAARILPLASIHSNLGYALSLAGETQHGQQELEEALRLDSTSRKTQYLLGVLLLDHRSRDLEALENLRGARQEVPQARMALAVFYVRDEKYDAAEQEIRGFLGPQRSGEFQNAWNWACLVAERPRPATAFGLDRK